MCFFSLGRDDSSISNVIKNNIECVHIYVLNEAIWNCVRFDFLIEGLQKLKPSEPTSDQVPEATSSTCKSFNALLPFQPPNK